MLFNIPPFDTLREFALYLFGSILFTFIIAFIIKSYLFPDKKERKIYDRSSSVIVRGEIETRLKREKELQQVKLNMITIPSVNVSGMNTKVDCSDLIKSRPIQSVDAVLRLNLPDSLQYYSRFQEITFYPKEMIEPLKPRYEEKSSPKLLVCHDMRGNYLGDSNYYGSTFADHPYQVMHWSSIDIFVYFSHEFVTIPPLSWINCCHRHGVKVLGTLITEWDEGRQRCEDFLSNDSKALAFATKLADLAFHLGFDGWLINIENELLSPAVQVPRMLLFLGQLKTALQAMKPEGLVIWYDAVITTGKLQWQDKLTYLNKPFFDVTDGIFINYTWKLENISMSKDILLKNDSKNSEKNENRDKEKEKNPGISPRQCDLYFGCDVFGRGTFAGGGNETFQAVHALQAEGVSCAIFAPGWTLESNDLDIKTTSSNSLEGIQRRLTIANNLLFDKICSVWNLNKSKNIFLKNYVHENIFPTEFENEEGSKGGNESEYLPLNISFSQSVGKYIFINGFKTSHPIFHALNHEQTVSSSSTDISIASNEVQLSNSVENENENMRRRSEYYDLNLQDSIFDSSILYRTFTSDNDDTPSSSSDTASSCHNFIETSLNFNFGYEGSSSLELSGVFTPSIQSPVPGNTEATRPSIFIPKVAKLDKISIPILSVLRFDANNTSASAAVGKTKTISNTSRLSKLGTATGPIIVKYPIIADCAGVGLGILLTFREGSSRSSGTITSRTVKTMEDKHKRVVKNKILLTSALGSADSEEGAIHSAVFGKGKVKWCARIDNSTDKTIDLDDKQLLVFAPSIALRQDSFFKLDSKNDFANDNVGDLHTPLTLSKQHWILREYYINPTSLTDLSSRDLLSVSIVCFGYEHNQHQLEAERFMNSIEWRFRFLLGYVHINSGADFLPVSLISNVVSIPLTANGHVSTLDSSVGCFSYSINYEYTGSLQTQNFPGSRTHALYLSFPEIIRKDVYNKTFFSHHRAACVFACSNIELTKAFLRGPHGILSTGLDVFSCVGYTRAQGIFIQVPTDWIVSIDNSNGESNDIQRVVAVKVLFQDNDFSMQYSSFQEAPVFLLQF